MVFGVECKQIRNRIIFLYGLRHQAVEDMTDNENISFAAAASRAGLLLESFNNLFRYINGSKEKDMRCARSLAGWPDVTRGGKCPGIDCMSFEDQRLFKCFVTHLFRNAPTSIKKDGADECIGIILVKSFEEIYKNSKYGKECAAVLVYEKSSCQSEEHCHASMLTASSFLETGSTTVKTATTTTAEVQETITAALRLLIRTTFLQLQESVLDEISTNARLYLKQGILPGQMVEKIQSTLLETCSRKTYYWEIRLLGPRLVHVLYPQSPKAWLVSLPNNASILSVWKSAAVSLKKQLHYVDDLLLKFNRSSEDVIVGGIERCHYVEIYV
jgi:hypothetical protein